MRAITVVSFAVALAACGSADAGDTPSVDEGDGWRLLASGEVDVGTASLAVVPTDAALDAAWPMAGFADEPPTVDFASSVVIISTQSFGSGCEPVFRQVRIVPDTVDAVELQFVGVEPGTACAADERWHSVAVAVDRDQLPAGATVAWDGSSLPLD